MSIDSTTVRQIARLARLGIADDEVAPMATELARVLELADELGAARLDGIEPLAHPHEQTLAWRSDRVSEADESEAFLALAPDARSGLFVVPKVIE